MKVTIMSNITTIINERTEISTANFNKAIVFASSRFDEWQIPNLLILLYM